MSSAVFLDLGSTSHHDLDLSKLEKACTTLTLYDFTTPEQVLEHIGKAEIVISNKVILNATTLQTLAKQLKLICIAATGTNNVDLQAAQTLGIPVTNIRDYASQSVAEHVIALIFTLKRQLLAYQQAVQQGAWQRSPHFCLLDYPITPIAESTLGIVGYGTLGQATARLAEKLGMQILIAERPQQTPRSGRLAFEQVLQQADILSLHCPLTTETQQMINSERLSLMQPNALLINTARGGLVDEAALLQALKQGVIAGAGIDVLTQEPPKADSLLLQQQLPNLIITPHIAWASLPARQTLIDQLATIIEQFKQGHSMNRVV